MAISKEHKDRIEKRRAQVAKLHASGLHDCAVARKLGIHRDTARNDRRALGLPKNPTKRTKKNQARWEKSTGFSNVREIADTVIARECVRAGFPEVRSLTSLDILRALRYGGPGTIDEIRSRVETMRQVNGGGLRLSNSLSWSTVNGHLSKLRKLGLIETTHVEIPKRSGPSLQAHDARGRFVVGSGGGVGTGPRTYTLTKDFAALRADEYRRQKAAEKKRRQRAAQRERIDE